MIPANLVHAGAMFYIFGIFYDPLFNTFGWSRSQVAVALSIYLVAVGFSGPIAGRLTDRFGPRKLIGYGALAGGIIFLLTSRVTALWQFYVLYFFQGLAFAGCGLVPVNTALANWFNKKRGTAIGVAMTGISLGAITIVPLGGIVMERYGWQSTYIFLSVVTWVLVLPAVLFIMRDNPKQMGLLPDGKTPDMVVENGSDDQMESTVENLLDNSWTLSQAARSGYFWMAILSYMMVHIAFCSVLTHQIVYLTDIGISMASAAAALGLTGGIGGLGKLFFGYASDKSSIKLIAPLCAILTSIGIILLLMTKTTAMVWVFVVVFGFCMGGHAAIVPVVVGRLFGLSSYGTIYGIFSMFIASGVAAAPLIAGMAYEMLGNYFLIFSLCVLMLILGAIFLFWSIVSIMKMQQQ